MLRRTSVAAFATLFALIPAFAIPPVPRQSPEFAIPMEDGTQKLLSQFRGKVVCLEFLHTTCPHCQHASQVMSKLYTEYGPKGFQPIGVAFNPMAKMLVPDFVKEFQVNYPVGYSETDPVLDFLGISVMERYTVPQIVWIDRKGQIRSQTDPRGEDADKRDEKYWREEIEALIKEPAATTHHAKHSARRTPTTASPQS